ncbi:MAG TPA: hypothetical protein VGB55_08720 [Tepidisphaeraceae bacterium]|jgi:lipopolysaccharide transport system permease protein
MSATIEPTIAPVTSAEPRYVETVIRRKTGWAGVDWQELANHRELLYFLTWRDVKVKYKQAVFGPAWAIVVPLVSALIYYAVGMFAGFADQTYGKTPYIVWVYAGLLPWLFIQTAINGGGLALVNNQALLSKIYMPRIFIPTSMIGSAIVDMAMSSIIFVGMILFFMIKTGGAFVPSWQSIFVLPLFVLLLIGSLGTAYLLSAVTIMFRDLRFIIPFMTQLGIWLTAVVYPQTIFVKYDAAGNVIADYRNWLALNPFAGIVQGFRSAILGEPWQWVQLASSIVLCLALFVFGLAYFKRVERRFADIA